ncbi:hypothetical protein [Nocardiopsis sp. HUAS JQ3]|uniref:hypothetical protein n=1 Tax=Nocardiopsis sp. HUAS JQ3 TaxID=3061629 RepID=UPI0023A959D3|nr:hypothetical protein [Nocardiopsis sp. HUAS JQ3]WDZ93736.1 hypothetical protein PV789_14845 [Nocardiopsis sp. HUAS JQ3]
MPSMLLIVAGCELACACLLWVVLGSYRTMVGSHEEERLRKRDAVLTHLAVVAASGGAGTTLIVVAVAPPQSSGARALLAVLAVYVFVCAACAWATGYLDGVRHRRRVRDLLTVAMWTAVMAVFLALAGAVTDPGAREAVGAVAAGVLTLVAVVVMTVVTLGVMTLVGGEDRSAPRRPRGMSRQVWNRQQREWREYRRRYGTDRSGGAGYSGGGDGGDGGGGGD